ncbi:hypothetical protein ABRZ24_11985 [Brenneria populi]|uniref:LysR substrate-binding domain-containing protein n=1 Tax=Brenneria populi TaxID=1505588 RepID=A0ABU6JSR5_9GAMM|nr:hypothetical protein [Brenneria populi Li et al. 2015]
MRRRSITVQLDSRPSIDADCKSLSIGKRAGLARGDLVRILPGDETPSRPMHLLFHGDRHLSPRLRSFVDFIVREFSHHSQA